RPIAKRRLGPVKIAAGAALAVGLAAAGAENVRTSAGRWCCRPPASEVTKVYPEVRDGQFALDLEFVGEPPAHGRRGQTLQTPLALGDSAEALLLPRGGFEDEIGGHCAFVLDESGTRALKRPIRLGRSNPEHFEVLDGLAAGDRVIVSSYASFAGMDLIELTE